MLHEGCQTRRPFFLAVICLIAVSAFAQSLTLTTVSDKVYRADGSPASGTLLISWPGFTTSNGSAVAAGRTSVELSADGSFRVQLLPTAGGSPAGVTYSVVYQLSDATVKTEAWSVGTASPETLAMVRTTAGTGTASGQLATQQYVNAALFNVVHLDGDESITGTKQFAVAPLLPAPTQDAQAANKAYVDASIATGGGAVNEFNADVKMNQGLTVLGAVQANSFASTGSGPWSLQGSFGTLTQPGAGQSLIGFGTNGKLQVSENGAGIQDIAKLDSNGSVPAAVALAQAPTQCTGSFATGIQANGNANCSTASQIQLAETSAPAGIPNYGIFWFDATCHCAKVIANNGQPVQLGLTNVFNQDSNGSNPTNTLEQVNGANPQAFRVYGTWTNATNWERTGLTWDQADGYFVLKNENAGTGSQRGIGFWIGSNIRWAIDAASNLKPFVDNLYSVGSATLRPATGYFGTAVYSPALLLQGSANASGGPVNLNTQTAAIPTTNMLTSATVGQYQVSVYVESDATCSAPGAAALSVTLGWGDRTGARTITVPLQGAGVTNASLALGSTANFGQAVVSLWNNSASNNLTYSTNYTACTTGTGTYALFITYRRVQ
jgi:hypothetical protein